MLKTKAKSFTGFTIVELLVVIVVIGILAAISVVSYSGITQKAKETALTSDLTNAKTTLQMYQTEHGAYPNYLGDYNGVNYCPFGVIGVDAKYCLKSSSGANLDYRTNDPQKFTVSGSNGLLIGQVTESTSPSVIALKGSEKFDYTGNIVSWTVPAGVTNINITAKGAQGGYTKYETGGTEDPNTGEWVPTYQTTVGGKGAYVGADFTVTPGQTLSILVGQQPNSPASDYGYSFPGGGGGTFVALGANYTTASPLIVAGGGGAAGPNGYWWGFGDIGQSGQLVNINSSGDGGGVNPGTNGNGAPSAECAGGGGGFYTSGGNDTMYYDSPDYPEYAGVGAGGLGFRQGGTGGRILNNINEWVFNAYQPGGFGGGSLADYIGYCNTVAGSGGGYSGGSSASSGSGGAVANIGNGGGSYILPSATHQFSAISSDNGSGQVVISWQ